MKLIYCPHCKDVFSLRRKWGIDYCTCMRSGGKYDDNLNATIRGDAIPLGFENRDFHRALASRPDEGQGERFEAFVIPHSCPTITKRG